MFQLAWYTVVQMQTLSPHLTELDCKTLAEHFPDFADSVTALSRAH
jgi:hypothetical protein